MIRDLKFLHKYELNSYYNETPSHDVIFGPRSTASAVCWLTFLLKSGPDPRFQKVLNFIPEVHYNSLKLLDGNALAGRNSFIWGVGCVDVNNSKNLISSVSQSRKWLLMTCWWINDMGLNMKRCGKFCLMSLAMETSWIAVERRHTALHGLPRGGLVAGRLPVAVQDRHKPGTLYLAQWVAEPTLWCHVGSPRNKRSLQAFQPRKKRIPLTQRKHEQWAMTGHGGPRWRG